MSTIIAGWGFEHLHGRAETCYPKAVDRCDVRVIEQLSCRSWATLGFCDARQASSARRCGRATPSRIRLHAYYHIVSITLHEHFDAESTASLIPTHCRAN